MRFLDPPRLHLIVALCVSSFIDPIHLRPGSTFVRPLLQLFYFNVCYFGFIFIFIADSCSTQPRILRHKLRWWRSFSVMHMLFRSWLQHIHSCLDLGLCYGTGLPLEQHEECDEFDVNRVVQTVLDDRIVYES
ncbi:unnamed protein product [Vicia faba]|uniref:Uncharacterized protein n=1 Tax=Vicia faba TaxID=3906 RepID=A0AAV1B9N8_VICFA|nr:unnamed protein product [Vicia faba]